MRTAETPCSELRGMDENRPAPIFAYAPPAITWLGSLEQMTQGGNSGVMDMFGGDGESSGT